MQELIIDAPTFDDRESLSLLFSADLEELGSQLSPEIVLSTVDSLLNATNTHSIVRVARHSAGDAPVGVLVAHTWTSVKFGGPAFWIETLFVSNDHRRCGAGRRLVSDLIELGRSSGYQGIDLEAYRMNAPASYLYRALGFQRLGRVRYSIRL
jgi:ribosomal protein S18 acetylase RimI-like enzyme